jgi:hypothetical protein
MVTLEWTSPDGALQIIDIDASEEQVFESTAEVTDHTVESGASISDHVRPGGDTITVQGIVSNTPIAQPAFGMDGAAVESRPLSLRVGGKEVQATTEQWSQRFDRVKAVDRQVQLLKNQGQLCTLRTSLRVVSNVVIQGYSVTRSTAVGNALQFTLSVRKMRLASVQVVPVEAPAQRRGRRSQNRGAQPAQPTDRRSTLARGADMLRGLIQ